MMILQYNKWCAYYNCTDDVLSCTMIGRNWEKPLIAYVIGMNIQQNGFCSLMMHIVFPPTQFIARTERYFVELQHITHLSHTHKQTPSHTAYFTKNDAHVICIWE